MDYIDITRAYTKAANSVQLIVDSLKTEDYIIIDCPDKDFIIYITKKVEEEINTKIRYYLVHDEDGNTVLKWVITKVKDV